VTVRVNTLNVGEKAGGWVRTDEHPHAGVATPKDECLERKLVKPERNCAVQVE
jgi:hypothetical protein